VVGEYVYSSAYDQGEGWTRVDIGTGVTTSVTFPNLYPYTGAGAPAPSLRVHAAGNALNPRTVQIKLNGTQVADITMDFFDYIKANIPVTVADISSGSATVDIKNNCLTPNDRMVIAKTELTYARQFHFGNLNNFAFDLPASATAKYLEISGFSFGTFNPILYDLTNGKRYVGDISVFPYVRVVVEPSATTRKMVMVSQDPAYPLAISTMQPERPLDLGSAETDDGDDR